MKRPSCLMICMILIMCFRVDAGFTDSVQQAESFWINPAWQDRITRKNLEPGRTLKRELGTVCHSEDSVVALLKERLSGRETAFSFTMVYDFTFAEVGDILSRAEAAAVADDDYLAFSILGTHRNWGGFSGDVHVSYTVNYVASAAEELKVNIRVDEILADILNPGMNHEEQLQAIHDWIVLNVAYDDAADPEYSAWSALSQGRTVCQGYALLTCKMLQKCDIPVRIINSTAMNHAWNMVNLCGHWFHLDVTWNDPVPDVPGRILYTYYNLSDAQISQGPTPHYDWSDNAFEAPDSYTEGVCTRMPATLFSLGDAIMILQKCAKVDDIRANHINLDTNGDGRVNLEDAFCLLRTITDMETPPEGLRKSAAAYQTAPSFSAADMDALVDGFSHFTVDFYHALDNDPSTRGKNLFFSAYSIENALAMTWAGAKNETARQMAAVLGLNLPQDRFHPTLNALNIDINGRDDLPPPSGDAFALNLVNAVWSRIGYPFLPSYLDVIAANYDAGVRTLDFAGNPEPSRHTINQWVENQTRDKIKNLLPQGAITPDTTVVLTNAIYFRGSWYQEFDENLTAPGWFTRMDGSTVTAEIMHPQVKTRYLQGDGFDAVELPYVSPRFSEYEYPRELSMLLIIPHAGRFETTESQLTNHLIQDVVSSLVMGTVQLSLPKFEFGYEVGCRNILHGLGMIDPFEPLAADFSGMVDPDHARPWIDEIYHKAFVSVDEKGTEAAAATAVVMTETSIPEPVIISADKPFIFLIRDQVTDMILFMGRVLDPAT